MHSGMRKAKRSLADQITGGVSSMRDLAGDLTDAFQSLVEGRPPEIEELTMADAIRFFVNSKGAAPDAVAGAILRVSDKPSGGDGQSVPEEGQLVHLFFLNSEGRPLITAGDPRRTYLASRFDAELAGAFGTNNIVIFN
jgi:hypothetical protein